MHVPMRALARALGARTLHADPVVPRWLPSPALLQLAEFLMWPADVRAPVFARARSSLQAPLPNAQRRALARAFALRQERSSNAQRATAADSAGVDPGVTEAPAMVTPQNKVRRTRHSQGLPEAGWSDALADAMIRTADDAASVMQRRARIHRSHLAHSHVTASSPPLPQASPYTDVNSHHPYQRGSTYMENSLRGTEAAMACDREALGSASEARESSRSIDQATEDPHLSRVLQKLEQMDARLQVTASMRCHARQTAA